MSAPNGDRAARVHLILPPTWEFRQPPLSLARLKGFLHDHDVPARCHDWNLEYHYAKIRELTAGTLGLGLASIRRIAQKKSTIEEEKKRQARNWGVRNIPQVMRAVPRYQPFDTEERIQKFLSGEPGTADEVELAEDARLPGFLDEQLDSATAQGLFRDGDLFGLSFPSYQQVPAGLLLVRRLKARFPHSLLVAGGTAFEFLPEQEREELAERTGFDRIVLGPGEEQLLEICRSRLGRDALAPGPEGPTNRSIGGLLFDDFDLDSYINAGRSLAYQMYRHCYWQRCSYCAFRSPHATRDRVDVEQHVAILKELVETYRVQGISFVDNAIPGGSLERLARGLVEAEVPLRWEATIRPDRQSMRVDWPLVRQSGCTSLDVGLESGSPRILEQMNRGTVAQDVVPLLRSISEAGIRANVNVMMGFPGETHEDAEQTFALLRAAQPYMHHVATASFHLTTGSPIYQDPEAYGLRLRSDRRFRFSGIVEFEHLEDHERKFAEAEVAVGRLIEEFLDARGFKNPYKEES